MITLSSCYSLSKRNRNDTCLVRLILFIIYYQTASYCTITKNLGRYIEIQLQQVCKMQDTLIHFTHVIDISQMNIEYSSILGMIKLYTVKQNLNYIISTKYRNDLCLILNFLMRCEILFSFKYSRLIVRLLSRSLRYVACIEKQKVNSDDFVGASCIKHKSLSKL